MKNSDDKTNVMRLLDKAKIDYIPHGFAVEEGDSLDVRTAAQKLGKTPEEVFKTLVTKGAKGGYFVFVVPGTGNLDLKKAAKSVGEKSIEMLKLSELFPLTGYVHGGCSPVGMKKAFPTVIDESVLALKSVTVSAGKIGRQIELAPADLIKFTRAKTADIVTAE